MNENLLEGRTMKDDLSASARKVQQALDDLGMHCSVVELPDSTRTAKEAAQAVGCEVGQIVKSIVMMTSVTRRPVMVIASGSNRINEARIGEILEEPILKADAEFVRLHTGYAIGGVPPLGLSSQLVTFIDEDLLKYPTVWAAAGTPHAVFEFSPQNLPRMTGGKVISIK
jgi:prolyl-tRNA editing enzyme YbaK/EbsC (Cys-tRNA(Pro) deacylase)